MAAAQHYPSKWASIGAHHRMSWWSLDSHRRAASQRQTDADVGCIASWRYRGSRASLVHLQHVPSLSVAAPVPSCVSAD